MIWAVNFTVNEPVGVSKRPCDSEQYSSDHMTDAVDHTTGDTEDSGRNDIDEGHVTCDGSLVVDFQQAVTQHHVTGISDTTVYFLSQLSSD